VTSTASTTSPTRRPPWLLPASVGVIAIMTISALWALIVVFKNWEKIGV
jgi:hypothetical protein